MLNCSNFTNNIKRHYYVLLRDNYFEFHFDMALIKYLHTTVMLKCIVREKPDHVFIFDNLTLFFPVLDEIKTRYLYLDKT